MVFRHNGLTNRDSSDNMVDLTRCPENDEAYNDSDHRL